VYSPVTKQLVTHVRVEGLALVKDVSLVTNYNTRSTMRGLVLTCHIARTLDRKGVKYQ